MWKMKRIEYDKCNARDSSSCITKLRLIVVLLKATGSDSTRFSVYLNSKPHLKSCCVMFAEGLILKAGFHLLLRLQEGELTMWLSMCLYRSLWCCDITASLAASHGSISNLPNCGVETWSLKESLRNQYYLHLKERRRSHLKSFFKWWTTTYSIRYKYKQDRLHVWTGCWAFL